MIRYIAVARPEVMAQLVERMTDRELEEMDARCDARQMFPEEYVGTLCWRADRWDQVDLVGVAEVVDSLQV